MANHSDNNHSLSYGYLSVVWLFLLGLTSLTVAVAGIDLGQFTLAAALLIACVKSYLVLTIFMHVKFEDMLFKVFIAIAVIILLIVFVFTAFDVFFR